MHIKQDITSKPFSLLFISKRNLEKYFPLNVQFSQQSEKINYSQNSVY